MKLSKGPLMEAREFKQKRLDLGWTQAEMAEWLYSDIRTIGRWENGERSIPGPVTRALQFAKKVK